MRYGTLPVLVSVLRRPADVNNVRGAFAAAASPLMASLRQVTGRQQVEAGLPEDMIDVIVRFAVTAFTLTLTAEDRLAITLSGIVTNYAIRSVGLPERLGGFIEVTCVRAIGS